MVYNPQTKTVVVKHGYPEKATPYRNAKIVAGLSPFGAEGLSLVTKNNIPIAHFIRSGAGKIQSDRYTTYPYQALFGKVPGAPQGNSEEGVCWTKSDPVSNYEHNPGDLK